MNSAIYDEENPVVLMFTDGTISVSTDGENYTVDINVTCEDGESYHAVYNGPLDFGGGEPEPGFEYTLNPNWSVRYAGRHVTEEGVADWIAVDVESTEEQDLYFTAVWDAESYETYGIEYIVEAEIANMNALYGEYWVMFFTRYSSVEDDPWMPFDSGEYYAFAIGVDGDGNPTGKYQVSDKFEPEQLEASESYNKWLGNWRIENADGGYDITITADNPDVSYLISGWQADVFGNVGSAPSLTASFDVTTGDLVFSSQEDIANVTTNGEPCVLGFYGMNEAGSFYTGSYDIASASFDSESEGETAIVNGLSSDDVTFVAMMYFGLGETGNYAYSDPLYFPLTMTRVDEIQTKSVLNAGAAVRKVNSDKVFEVAAKSKATQAFFK